MAESLVQVTEGSGKKLHTWSRSIGANTVEDEAVYLADQPLATYSINTAAASLATANDHVLQIMAGGTLNVYVRRIQFYQVALATTAGISSVQILRLTTAGTGGTASTVAAHDTTDAAAGCTGMTLPTVKGTESTRLWIGSLGVVQTVPAAGVFPLIFDLDFDRLRLKPIRIAAGTTNGIAVKIITATAAATVASVAYVTEANF